MTELGAPAAPAVPAARRCHCTSATRWPPTRGCTARAPSTATPAAPRQVEVSFDWAARPCPGCGLAARQAHLRTLEQAARLPVAAGWRASGLRLLRRLPVCPEPEGRHRGAGRGWHPVCGGCWQWWVTRWLPALLHGCPPAPCARGLPILVQRSSLQCTLLSLLTCWRSLLLQTTPTLRATRRTLPPTETPTRLLVRTWPGACRTTCLAAEVSFLPPSRRRGRPLWCRH